MHTFFYFCSSGEGLFEDYPEIFVTVTSLYEFAVHEYEFFELSLGYRFGLLALENDKWTGIHLHAPPSAVDYLRY